MTDTSVNTGDYAGLSGVATEVDGQYIDNQSGQPAFYGPDGEPGYPSASAAPPGAVQATMPNGTAVWYVPGDMNYAAGGTDTSAWNQAATNVANSQAGILNQTLASQQQSNQTSAWATIQQYFQQMGITDPSALSWAQGLITSGASSAQVEVEMYGQSWFQARFPGIFLAQQNGLPPVSVSDYLNYEQTVSQLEQQVGLPQGFISSDEISQLIGQYNVSTSELTDRLTQGYAASQQAVANNPEIAQTLQDYYGVGPGGLAAYWLNPQTALSQLQNQYTAATIGAEGAITGWGSLSSSVAQQLASLGVTQQQAQQGFSTLAHMAQAYSPLPGEQGTGISQSEQVAGEFEGNAQAQLAMQLAAEQRQSAFEGGTNYTGSNSGASGLGPAVPNR